MFSRHKCPLNKDNIEIIDTIAGLHMCIPFDCGDPQDNCTSDVRILMCPFCGFTSKNILPSYEKHYKETNDYS